MGDIWISFHIQALGYKVAYNKASVYQKRNPHNLTQDMKDEFIGYERCLSITKNINEGAYKKEDFWPAKTCKAYTVYNNAFK